MAYLDDLTLTTKLLPDILQNKSMKLKLACSHRLSKTPLSGFFVEWRVSSFTWYCWPITGSGVLGGHLGKFDSFSGVPCTHYSDRCSYWSQTCKRANVYSFFKYIGVFNLLVYSNVCTGTCMGLDMGVVSLSSTSVRMSFPERTVISMLRLDLNNFLLYSLKASRVNTMSWDHRETDRSGNE